MADANDTKLAKRIQKHAASNPDHEISQIANAMGETPGRVTFILDQFLVAKGTVKFVGPGKGGGWVPLED
jgi:hypothetical protein